MQSVGVRELKHRTSAILREARKTGQDIAVTYRGQVVAYLVPAPTERGPERETTAWTSLDRLAGELGARWPKRLGAATAVRESRRG